MFKKLDDQRRKLLKELRDIEKFSCVPKEFQENLKRVSATAAARGVEQRRRDFMPAHQKVQKISQQIQSIQDKRRHLQKDSTAAEEEMRKLQEELMQKRGASPFSFEQSR